MKIYIKWRLKNIRIEIGALKKEIESPLSDNYTDHARLRSLILLEERLQQRLSGRIGASDRMPAMAIERQGSGEDLNSGDRH